MKTARLFSDQYGQLLMLQVGRTRDAEHALAIANTVGDQRDLYRGYSFLIPAMTKVGQAAEVQKLIDAWTGNPARKSISHGWIVDGMVAAGDADGARKYAESHHLADMPQGKLSLDGRLLASKKVAGDKAEAEPLIRKMFAIGQNMDNAGGVSHGDGNHMTRYTDQHIAQNGARTALENGYVDLRIELYQKAANKDQRPLLAAFNGKISTVDMTGVLMLAQSNVESQSSPTWSIMRSTTCRADRTDRHHTEQGARTMNIHSLFPCMLVIAATCGAFSAEAASAINFDEHTVKPTPAQSAAIRHALAADIREFNHPQQDDWRVVRADLNDDGRPDRLVKYTYDSSFCGSMGCSGAIMMATAGGYVIEPVSLPNFHNRLDVLITKHHGMHDLHFDDATHVFKWNDKEYQQERVGIPATATD